MENQEASILDRIAAARGNKEPEQSEPTENTEPVDVLEEEPPAEPEAEDETLEAEETEQGEDFESVESDNDAEDDKSDGEDLFYIDLDGEEVSFEEIRKWKSGSMMQEDYTQKTQALAEQRKSLESKSQEVESSKAELSEALVKLKVLLDEESLTPEQIQEMREYEPEEYIKYTERKNKIEAAIAESKNLAKTNDFSVDEERQKLFSNNPQWIKDGKLTDVFTKDSEAANKYAGEIGLTAERIASFDAAQMQMLIDAAKFKGKANSNAAIEKRVRKAPLATKPKQKANSGLAAELDKAQKAFKKNPTDVNAIQIRKIKRKMKGN